MNALAVGLNARTWIELQDVADLGGYLGRLDGDRVYSLVVWRLPQGRSFGESDPRLQATEYLQCAGTSSRMTIEIRRRDGETYVQYCVGEAPDQYANGDPGAEAVEWAGHRVHVSVSELYDAESAKSVFEEYCRSGDTPPKCTLRKIVVGGS